MAKLEKTIFPIQYKIVYHQSRNPCDPSQGFVLSAMLTFSLYIKWKYSETVFIVASIYLKLAVKVMLFNCREMSQGSPTVDLGKLGKFPLFHMKQIISENHSANQMFLGSSFRILVNWSLYNIYSFWRIPHFDRHFSPGIFADKSVFHCCHYSFSILAIVLIVHFNGI